MICPTYKAALLPEKNGFDRVKEGDAECDRESCMLWSDKRKKCGLIAVGEVTIDGNIRTHPY